MTELSSRELQSYIEAFQKAIVLHLDKLKDTDGAVFNYREINLRSAIEKKLYFKYLNNQSAQLQFQSKGTVILEENQAETSAITDLKRTLRKWRGTTAPSFNFTGKKVVLCNNPKHEKYAKHVLGNEADTDYLRAFDKVFETLLKSQSPDRKLASSYMWQHHFDVLIECEAMLLLTDQFEGAWVLVEGNTMRDTLLSLVSRAQEGSTTCLQYGWAFNVHLGFQRMEHSTYLSWADLFSDALQPYNPNTTFINAGHPALEASSNTQKIKRSVSVIMQAPVGWISQKSFDLFVEEACHLATQNWQVLVREHPAWPLSDSTIEQLVNCGCTMVNNQEVSLDEQLAQTEYCMTIFSSVGFEASVKNNYALFAQFDMDINMLPNPDGSKWGQTFHTPEQFRSYMQSIGEKGPQEFEPLIATFGADSKDRITSFLSNIS